MDQYRRNNLQSVDELWSDTQQNETKVFKEEFIRDSYAQIGIWPKNRREFHKSIKT